MENNNLSNEEEQNLNQENTEQADLGNNQQESKNAQEGAPQVETGKWVPVDPSTLGFSINGDSNQPIQGPDGNIYCIGTSAPTLAPVNPNSHNAIPRPSSIVQMPPIVQPISLVPYTSQNQPMLQYDPYSRPLPPEGVADRPRYKKKPYKGISLLLCFISFMLIISLLVFENVRGTVAQSTGLDIVKSMLVLANVGSFSSVFFDNAILPLGNLLDAVANNATKTILTVAIPVIVTLIVFISACLIIKYLYRFASDKSPRGFSAWGFTNILLHFSLFVILYVLSLEYDINNDIVSFILLKSNITYGLGLVISTIFAIMLFFVPFAAKKHAHILDNSITKTYFIEQ